MQTRWLLIIPLGLAVVGLLTGVFAFKVGVAISCACIVGRCRFTGSNPAVAWVSGALMVSAAGDWFLAHRNGRASFFLAGIALFFCTHVGFLAYCLRNGKTRWVVLTAAFAVYLPYYFFLLLPAIGSTVLRVAVLLYLLISCCVLAAACGLGSAGMARWGFVVGITLLVFSDTLISLSEFLQVHDAIGLILPTYYLSHVCIAWAVLSASAVRPTRQADKPSGEIQCIR